jgi:hypothetical protein
MEMRNLRVALVARAAAILVVSMTWLAPATVDASIAGQDSPLQARVQTFDYQLIAEGVEVPGYALHTTPGAPRLPLTGVTFELPDSGDWQLNFESSGSRVLDQQVAVAAVPVPNLEYASLIAPEKLEELPSSVPVVDRPDASIYGVDAFYPASPVVAGEVVVQGGRRILPVQVFPFQYNPVTRQLRYHPDLLVTVQVQRSVDTITSTATPSTDFYQPTALPGAGVLRIHTKERGLYRLTQADLSAKGLAVGAGGVNPNTFAIYYKGQQIDIQVTGANDNMFDPGDMVIFYAVPYDGGRFQNYNIYHFVWGNGVPSPQRMEERTVTAPGVLPAVSIIRQTLRMETDKTYYTNLDRPSDADHFLDDPLEVKDATPVVKTYELALNSPVTTAGNVEIKALLYGGKNQAANPDQSVQLKLNSHAVGVPFQWDGNTEYLVSASATSAWLDGAPNRVHLEAALSQLPSLPLAPPCATPANVACYYWVWPDWLEVNYPALANAVDNRLYIESLASPASTVAAAGFSSSSVAVIDVSDATRPQRLVGFGVQSSGGLSTVYWNDDNDPPTSSYVLSTDAGLRAPGAIERIDRSGRPAAWANPSLTYDYIAIVGMERSYNGTTALGGQLSTALQGLVTHRTADGFNVAVIPVEDIYDEWSYSRIDPMAIRSFFHYAYQNWRNGANEPPGYALLVGDGHYDFNKVTTQPLPNLIPPYLADVDIFWGEVPADNLYVSVDSLTDYLPDIALGRMPVNTAAELTAITAKITTYESTTLNPPGAWQQHAVYATGNCNDTAANLHTLSNNGRLTGLPTAYTNQRLYFDPTGGVACPDGNYASADTMRPAARQAFSNGAFYLQWFGHGAQTNWAGGGTFLAVSDFFQQVIGPTTKLPFTAGYACLTGYFAYNSPFASRQSLAELQVSTPQRGSIADFSPSGLHLASEANNLQVSLHKTLFQQRIPRAGDVVDAAKLDFIGAGGGSDVVDTMVFFGDPAVKLRYATGDLSTSTLEVNQSAAAPGAVLEYTLTVRNSSIYTTSKPQVVVDYPETQATVDSLGGAINNGSTLTWNLSDLPTGGQHTLIFRLQESAGGRSPESYDLIVPATVSSQMAPVVNLQTSTTIESALAVTLDYFSGVANYPTHVSLEWQSVSELNNAGFNLYRTGSADNQPAPADLLAYLPSQAPGSTAGAAYSLQDSNVVVGQTYWYWLEDVDLSGATALHGPISVSFEAPTAVTLVEMQADGAGALPAVSLALLALATAVALGGGVFARRRISAGS